VLLKGFIEKRRSLYFVPIFYLNMQSERDYHILHGTLTRNSQYYLLLALFDKFPQKLAYQRKNTILPALVSRWFAKDFFHSFENGKTIEQKIKNVKLGKHAHIIFR
jgi:hypothetical protein